jgi:hypothetical protein
VRTARIASDALDTLPGIDRLLTSGVDLEFGVYRSLRAMRCYVAAKLGAEVGVPHEFARA